MLRFAARPSNSRRLVCIRGATILRSLVWIIAIAGFEQGIAAEPTAGAKQVVRTWNDSSGKFSVEASFVEIRGGKVMLKRRDGETVAVPVARLSNEDRKFLKEFEQADNPFGDSAVVKKQPNSSDDSQTPAPTEPASDAGAKERVLKPDFSEMKVVRPATFATWTFKPKSNVAPLDPKLPRATITLTRIPDSDPFFENPSLFVAQDGTRAIVARRFGRVGGNERELYVEDIDLAAARHGVLATMPPQTAVLDVWPAERMVLFRPDISGESNDVLTLAKLDGKHLNSLVSWLPFYSGNPHDTSAAERDVFKSIDGAWFLSADRIMTKSTYRAELVVWDAKTAKAKILIPLKEALANHFALSFDRRFIAIKGFGDASIPIFDLERAIHIATLKAEPFATEVAFSDDNQRLACIDRKNGRVAVWDLNTGNPLSTFSHPVFLKAGALAWASDFLLVNGTFLFDPARHILLWDYQLRLNYLSRLGPAIVCHDGRVWTVPEPMSSPSPPSHLVSAIVPEDKALKVAASLPRTEMKPGDSALLGTATPEGAYGTSPLPGEPVRPTQTGVIKTYRNANENKH